MHNHGSMNFTNTMKTELGDAAGAAFAANALLDPGCWGRASKMWGGLLPHFVDWIDENAIYPIRLMQRDCEPLRLITGWRDMYLTRRICGIGDELAHSKTAPEQNLLPRYIAQETDGRPFSMVDSGCWGSIVMNLGAKGVECQPLFFFSRNPWIKSFLGEPKTRAAIGKWMPDNEIDGFCGALNDTYECCIPKRWKSPAILIKRDNEHIRPKLETNDSLSVQFSHEFERGLTLSARMRTMSDAMGDFVQEYKLAQRGKSAIMTPGSPKWSEGEKFLGKFRSQVKMPRGKTL